MSKTAHSNRLLFPHMKIEIAESLVYSWLRKVRNCRIVQTNWTPAAEWARDNEAELEKLMQESTRYFADVLKKGDNTTIKDTDGIEYEAEDKLTDTSDDARIFKKTASLEQLIAQTECDVLGLSVEKGEYKAIAVEVAFHENGLNYSGGRIVTAKKIAAKFLRIIFALRAYFGVEEAELIFASPHVKNATLLEVTAMMDELNAFLAKANLGGFSVSVLFNEDFCTEMLIPLVDSVKNHGAGDGSELFTRALKLVELADKLPTVLTPSVKESAIPAALPSVPGKVCAKVGNIVVSAAKSRRSAFRDWLIARGIKPNTASAYVSGVNTSALFAREELQWVDADFFGMTDAAAIAQKATELIALPAYRQFSRKSNDSRKCGLERYVEFVKQSI